MALPSTSLSWSSETLEVRSLKGSLPTILVRPCFSYFHGQSLALIPRQYSKIRCCSSGQTLSPFETKGNIENPPSVSVDEELAHVMRFKMSDFKVLNSVSIGLSGRSDEVVFEAIVKDSKNPLKNTKVVLRRLVSAQAKRRGKRAIEVLKKLAHRKIMYYSYSMQVHGYASSSKGSSSRGFFTLVHGNHDSFSLRHWLQQSDWLPTLEAALALDEESVKRVGDDTIGGPTVSRQLRMIRILMRDLLIGVNYLHSHGLAHTELRLENIHVSPVDRHIKVGILGNAADFYKESPPSLGSSDRRQMMIAFDMRCVGFVMAKMVLRELMDPLPFSKFKAFLTKGNDPSCLREFLLQILHRNSPSGNCGLQILDRNWGAGWNLLSLLLATDPSKRISCLEALRHPFLCGPRWRVIPSMNIIRWGLGSTAVRITEEYIYGQTQRSRLAHFIDLMEMLNPHSNPKNWLELLPGKWRLLYSTGRHVGLTLRQPPTRVLMGNVYITVSESTELTESSTTLSFTSDIGFQVVLGSDWPHNKKGISGNMKINSLFSLTAGQQLYHEEEEEDKLFSTGGHRIDRDALFRKLSTGKWGKAIPYKELPSSLPVAKLVSEDDIEVTMSLDEPLSGDADSAGSVVREVRVQIPPESFDLSKLVFGTYVDSRLLVLRGVNGSALLFTRSCHDDDMWR